MAREVSLSRDGQLSAAAAAAVATVTVTGLGDDAMGDLAGGEVADGGCAVVEGVEKGTDMAGGGCIGD